MKAVTNITRAFLKQIEKNPPATIPIPKVK